MNYNEPKLRRKLSGRAPIGTWSYSAGYSPVTDPRIHGNTGTTIDVLADAPPLRHELFLLPEGECKVVETPETRVPHAAIFHFNKEDHTLGNMIRDKLTRTEHVIFAGYRVPHPLVAEFDLRVQTDGHFTPRDAVIKACEDLVQDLGLLDQRLTREWELSKVTRRS